MRLNILGIGYQIMLMCSHQIVINKIEYYNHNNLVQGTQFVQQHVCTELNNRLQQADFQVTQTSNSDQWTWQSTALDTYFSRNKSINSISASDMLLNETIEALIEEILKVTQSSENKVNISSLTWG